MRSKKIPGHAYCKREKIPQPQSPSPTTPPGTNAFSAACMQLNARKRVLIWVLVWNTITRKSYLPTYLPTYLATYFALPDIIYYCRSFPILLLLSSSFALSLSTPKDSNALLDSALLSLRAEDQVLPYLYTITFRVFPPKTYIVAL